MADVSAGGTPDQAAHDQAARYQGAPVESAQFEAARSEGAQFEGAQFEGAQFEAARSTSVVPVGVLTGPVPADVQAAEGWAGHPGEPLPPGRRRTGWRRGLPIAGVILFLLAASIGMLLFLGVDMGPSALAVGLTAAVLPVPLLVASFLWLDRYEPEPIRYLAFCFAWGAAVATGVALAVNTGAALLFDKIGLPDALVAVLVAPFIEETMKACGPLLLFWRRRAEWSGITDGIVYCGLSALGFAMVENVLYLGKHGYASGVEEYGPASGLTNLFAIFIVRILFTGFAHPLFTAMSGIGLGIAARAGDRRVRWLAPIAGLLLAMILHGLFNLLPTLSVTLSQPLIMLYGYLGFMVPFFFAVVGFAVALRAWEGRLTERVLPFYVGTGWFSPPEVAALGSLGRRHSARQWAKRVAGEGGHRAMRSFQFAATQLALLRDGMQRGLNHRPDDLHRVTAEEQRLLTSLLEYRSAFAGRDPQTPQAFWDGRNYQIAFPDGVTRAVSPPAEPVVPVPVRYAPPPMPYPMAYGDPAMRFGAPVPYSAAPPFAPPPAYGPPAGYQPYGGPPAYGPPGGYQPLSAPPAYPPAGYQPLSAPPAYPPAGYQPLSAPPAYPPAGYQPLSAPPAYGPPAGYQSLSAPPAYPPGSYQQPYSAPPAVAPPPPPAWSGGWTPPPAAPPQPWNAQPPTPAFDYSRPPADGTPPPDSVFDYRRPPAEGARPPQGDGTVPTEPVQPPAERPPWQPGS